MSTQYERCRTLKELRAELKNRKWRLQSKRYKEGSDYVSVDFVTTDGTKGTFLLSPFNGKFFGRTKDGIDFQSDYQKHDQEAWFCEILDAVYIAASEVEDCKDGQLVKITCGTYQGSIGLLRVRNEAEPPHAVSLSVTCSPMKFGGHVIRKAGRELKGGWNGHTVPVTKTQIEPAR